MSEQITIENLQQEVAALKVEKEGLQEKIATLENKLKETEKSKDYWYERSNEMDAKRGSLASAMVGLRSIIDAMVKNS